MTAIAALLAESLSSSLDAIQAVERGHLVALGQRRIVEHGVDEVLQLAAQRHHRLSDVQQLARAFADDVHAEQIEWVSRWKISFSRPVVSPRIWPRAISR